MAVPSKRDDELLVEDMGDEIVVYDIASDEAHLLNETAAVVWRAVDGERSVAALAEHLALDPAVVEVALARLDEARLLVRDDGPGYRRVLSRRGLLKRAGMMAGAVALPVVRSVVAPAPAAAASVPNPTIVPIPGTSTTTPPTTHHPTTTTPA